MKILITGGAGMIGSHCAEYFARKGHRVVVYDSLIRSQIFHSSRRSVEYNWYYLKQFSRITLIKKDVRDRAALNQVFRQHRFGAIIHTAGQTGVRFSLDNPYEDFAINCLGTINVLEAMRKYAPKASFIFCSTNKVYGDNVNYLAGISRGVKETTSVDLTGHTPYGASKLAADLYVQDYAHTFGLKTGVFRMSCIYGTRQFGFADQGWLAWFCLNVIKDRPITIYGNGRQRRDVLWVEDLVKAYDKFINNSKVSAGVFNIGGGPQNTLSLLELVARLEKVTGKKAKVKFAPWRPFDQKVYISSLNKVKKVLGWEPQVSPQEGIKRLVAWIKQAG